MCKISIVLPVYNASTYLLEALESISNQTYTNWELIAINDGSTDNSLELLQEYSKKEPRLRIISRSNKGLPYTLNEGIHLAKGEYIARMDADDISLPQRLEKQLQYINEKNADLCGSQYVTFGSYTITSSLPLDNTDCKLQLLFCSAFAHPTILVKKSVLEKYKYNESYKCAQDYELWCRMAKDNVIMVNTPDVLLKYRYHENSISTKKRKDQVKYAEIIANSYWLSNNLTKDLPFPSCVTNVYNDKKTDLINSIITLLNLHEKSDNEIKRNIIKQEIINLFPRLSIYGLKTILFFIKRCSFLRETQKLIFICLSIIKFYKIKSLIKSYISPSAIYYICSLIYDKRIK